jgi:hypothetical protein
MIRICPSDAERSDAYRTDADSSLHMKLTRPSGFHTARRFQSDTKRPDACRLSPTQDSDSNEVVPRDGVRHDTMQASKENGLDADIRFRIQQK